MCHLGCDAIFVHTCQYTLCLFLILILLWELHVCYNQNSIMKWLCDFKETECTGVAVNVVLVAPYTCDPMF